MMFETDHNARQRKHRQHHSNTNEDALQRNRNMSIATIWLRCQMRTSIQVVRREKLCLMQLW